jgi:3(or 17)beta-hydroxysteroid dehydrogenase
MPTARCLDGRIALVTGGASGLGRAAAEAAADAGAHVLIADIDDMGGRAVADTIAGSFIALDVADENAWLNVETLVKREHGGLDMAVLAAGIAGPMVTLSRMSLSDWRKLMAVNLDGTMLGVRSALRLMEGRGGSIITVASVNGVRCTPTMSAYAASKAGVRVLTRVGRWKGPR